MAASEKRRGRSGQFGWVATRGVRSGEMEVWALVERVAGPSIGDPFSSPPGHSSSVTGAELAAGNEKHSSPTPAPRGARTVERSSLVIDEASDSGYEVESLESLLDVVPTSRAVAVPPLKP
jgi:hypothetical protein